MCRTLIIDVMSILHLGDSRYFMLLTTLYAYLYCILLYCWVVSICFSKKKKVTISGFVALLAVFIPSRCIIFLLFDVEKRICIFLVDIK